MKEIEIRIPVINIVNKECLTMVDFDQRFEHEGSLCESGIETHQ
jgi:hypothetical protein